MKHLGDITKINGADAPVVNVIIGGSPCQDLSVAGKRAGLAGERSGLFMEQIRIIKEMREADEARGRTDEHIRPRFMVWENVPGAFSSNGGADFGAVLQETVKVVCREAPPIPMFGKGWPPSGCLADVEGKWSVAWRVFDAQFWGVPQRRRRIALVADFGGLAAPEILFERESVSGDSEKSRAEWKRAAAAAEAGFDPAVGDCMTAWDCQSKRIFDTNGKSPTLQGGIGGGVNNPAIFCMATQQGGAELRTDDRAPTLTAAAGMSGNNQPVVAIPINDKATRWQGGGESRNHDGSGNGLGIGKEGDPSPTLTAGDRHGVMCLNDQGGNVMGVSHDVSGTLRAQEHGHQPSILDMSHACDVIRDCGEVAPVVYSFDSLSSNSMKSKNPHSGCREVEVAKTLDTTDPTPSKNQGGIAVVAPAVMAFATNQREEVRDIGEKSVALAAEPGMHCQTFVAQKLPAVALDMTHACDVIRECGEQVPALQARMGTGGNQVPLTYGIGNGQACEASIMAEEIAQTLNTMHDAQAVMCSAVDCRNFTEGGEVNGTLQAKESGGQSLNLNNTVRQNMVVRRLTPMECERLQGFPDGWTDIGEWTDSKGKLHKESSDSARYKALGNSIALPSWFYVLSKLSEYCEEKTMASLFDGISGFNVCWARIHGTENCLWSSEIEEFPIAVVKKHFGDEDTGEEGDFEKFFRRDEKENV